MEDFVISRHKLLGGSVLLSATAGVIVPDVFDAIMQTDPIRWQEETITAVIVGLLMSLCLCVEAGVSREDAREGWEVRSLSLFFLMSGGVSGSSPQRPSSLPACSGKQKGLFL